MIGLFARFMRSWTEHALPEPSAARRRIMTLDRGQLRALLASANIHPPGLWSATTDALRSVVVWNYNLGRISDEQIEDIN